MRCQNLSEHLSAYIDGIVDPPLASEIEQHLQTCPGCRLEYEELKAVIKLVRDLPEVTPLPGFHTGLHQKLQQLPPPVAAARATGPFFQKWLGVLAVAAVLGVIFGMATLWSQQFKSLMHSFVAMGGTGTIEQVADNHKPPAKELNLQLAENDQGQAGPDHKISVAAAPVTDGKTEKVLQEEEQNSSKAKLSPAPELKPAPLPVGGGSGQPAYSPTPLPEDDGEQETAADNKDQSEFRLMMSDAAPAKEEVSPKHTTRQMYGEPKSALQTKSLVALEYDVIIKTNQDDIYNKINLMVGHHHGFVSDADLPADSKLVLHLPPDQAEQLIEAMKQLGQVEYQQHTRDLTDEYLAVQNRFLDLLRQEQATAAAIEQQKPANSNKKQELVRLDEQIKQQQKTLTNLNQRIELARVELLITHP